MISFIIAFLSFQGKYSAAHIVDVFPSILTSLHLFPSQTHFADLCPLEMWTLMLDYARGYLQFWSSSCSLLSMVFSIFLNCPSSSFVPPNTIRFYFQKQNVMAEEKVQRLSILSCMLLALVQSPELSDSHKHV